ncbi:class I SAM-dependent methyltransferase [Thiosocius teredinicola]|uniref:class I SAM-dependent methyltransferase n=1 Tax=Thiosocius teredinicola TaxID=1973002 RepID=UPI0013DE075A
MSPDNYFVRTDYVINDAVTFDSDGEFYWDEKRVHNSLSYQASVYEWAEEIVREKGLVKVADVGCGTAAKLARLNDRIDGLSITGFDQPNATRLCEQHYQFGDWIGVDLSAPDRLVNDHFDLVICSDVIEHLANPDTILWFLKQLAGPETLFLISTPERVRLRGAACNYSPIRHHVREWSAIEFRQYLNANGFNPVEVRMLAGFDWKHDAAFFKRALRRWLRLRSIKYTQACLCRLDQSE